MRFVKMHGAGNDYVLVDEHDLPASVDLPRLSRAVSDRRRGVGSDGLIIVRESAAAAGRMEMYNADGSRSPMCGNGLRLVAKLLVESSRSEGDSCDIDTDCGIRRVQLFRSNGRVTGGRASMGEPILERARIPVAGPQNDRDSDGFVREWVEVDGLRAKGTCLSMGNPHIVLFVDHVEAAPLHRWGPPIENDPRFPERVNVEFVEVHSRNEVVERTWERGAGETDSCGTGACATAVALIAAGRADRRVCVRQRGGELDVEWAADGHVYLSGPATTAFEGNWTLDGADAV